MNLDSIRERALVIRTLRAPPTWGARLADADRLDAALKAAVLSAIADGALDGDPAEACRIAVHTSRLRPGERRSDLVDIPLGIRMSGGPNVQEWYPPNPCEET